MRFNRITPAMLIAIFTLLALLLAYLALNTLFWHLVSECGAVCGGLMAEPVIRMFGK